MNSELSNPKFKNQPYTTKSLTKLNKVALVGLGLVGLSSSSAIAGTKNAALDLNFQKTNVEISNDVVTINGREVQGVIDMNGNKSDTVIPISHPNKDTAIIIATEATLTSKGPSVIVKTGYQSPNTSLNSMATLAPQNTTINAQFQNTMRLDDTVKIYSDANIGIRLDGPITNLVQMKIETLVQKVRLDLSTRGNGIEANLMYNENVKQGAVAKVKHSESQQSKESKIDYRMSPQTQFSVISTNGIGANTNNSFAGSVKNNFGDPKININAGVQANFLENGTIVSESALYSVTPYTQTQMSVSSSGESIATINYSSIPDKLKNLSVSDIQSRIDEVIRKPQIETQSQYLAFDQQK